MRLEGWAAAWFETRRHSASKTRVNALMAALLTMRPNYSAAAFLPIASLTRGITCSASNVIDRLASAGSTQSMPA